MDIQATKIQLAQILLQIEKESLLLKIQKLFREENVLVTDNIPAWQIEETTKRLEALKNGTLKTKKWDDVKNEIFK